MRYYVPEFKVTAKLMEGENHPQKMRRGRDEKDEASYLKKK